MIKKCVLFFLLVAAGASAWGAAIQYNTAPGTGQVLEPSASPTPAVQRAYAQGHTEDGPLQVTVGVSLIEWDVPAQSDVWTLTLPPIGTANGDVPSGFKLFVRIIDANGNSVPVVDEIGTIASLDAGAIYEFTANIDGTWTATNLAFGTAAYVNTGTSGGTTGLLNGNWVKTGTTEFQGNVEIDGSSRLYFNSSSASYITANPSFPNAGVDFVTPTTGSLTIFGGEFFQFNPTSGQTAKIKDTGNAGMIFSTDADVMVRFSPNNTQALEVTDNGTLIATGGSGGARVAKWLPGKATLVAGTVTVTDAAVTSGSIIVCTPEGTGTGHLNYTISAGASFTISSSDGADTRTVSYQRIVP